MHELFDAQGKKLNGGENSFVNRKTLNREIITALQQDVTVDSLFLGLIYKVTVPFVIKFINFV